MKIQTRILVYDKSLLQIIRHENIAVQEEGIRIDIPVTYTHKGILEGRDEILEKAIEYLETDIH